MLLLVLTSWLERRERQAIAYLIEENRLLRRQLGGRRLRFTDDERRRLAVRAHRLGRQALREIATIVTPDTLLRWHRQLCELLDASPQLQDLLPELRLREVRYLQTNHVGGSHRRSRPPRSPRERRNGFERAAPVRDAG
jgi:hypothetical protein